METPFEGWAIEQIASHFPRWNHSFYRTQTGSEIDLIMTKGRKTVALEMKTSMSPTLTRGFWESLKAISPDEKYVICPVSSSYSLKDNVTVTNLKEFLATFPG